MIERDESIASSDSDTLHWILRISVAACFIGHGAFDLITKAACGGSYGAPLALAWLQSGYEAPARVVHLRASG
jgi:hypothetical protein